MFYFQKYCTNSSSLLHYCDVQFTYYQCCFLTNGSGMMSFKNNYILIFYASIQRHYSESSSFQFKQHNTCTYSILCIVLPIFLFQETLHKIGYCTALFLIIAQQKLHKTPCKLYYSKGGHYKGQVTAYYCHKVVVKHYTKIISNKRPQTSCDKEYKFGTYLAHSRKICRAKKKVVVNLALEIIQAFKPSTTISHKNLKDM